MTPDTPGNPDPNDSDPNNPDPSASGLSDPAHATQTGSAQRDPADTPPAPTPLTRSAQTGSPQSGSVLSRLARVRPTRIAPEQLAERYTSPLHDTRVAAWLGLALGVSFTVCFATGVWSHLAQEPPSWFAYPARPAGLYRLTQGLHVATGMASIPLLLAKLWTVYPHVTAWPPVRSVLHGVERLALLPLVGGSLFLLFSGVANVARWYPWTFYFPRAHFWAAWLTIGALVVHIGAKATATRNAVLSRRIATAPDPAAVHPAAPDPAAVPDPAGPDPAGPDPAGPGSAAHDSAALGPDAGSPAAASIPATAGDPEQPDRGAARDRRAFLGGVAAASGALVVATAGGTFSPFGGVSVLAQRTPGLGPQGLPVNKSADGAGVTELALQPTYRLVVEGAVDRPLELSLADLQAMDQHDATLPIACVEGWSASARWRGIPVRDLLALSGARDGATVAVESLQSSGRYRHSDLNPDQAGDRDTLLALRLNGEDLHLDHGYPVRLIGPNRPGVLQTKWVNRLVVS
jgi:hypothetical protein